MNIILETPRLILREMTKDDAVNAYQLNLDPDVIRYTGDQSFASIQEAVQFLENYEHYKTYGFGRWAVIEKTNAEFLGWCGLKFDPAVSEHDIGFRFFKRHWNKGFATESANACLRLGFEKHSIPVIVGRAMNENLASIHVLQKIGLSYWKPQDCGGKSGVVYRKFNPNLPKRNAFQ